MTTHSVTVDLPPALYYFIESEVAKGHFDSKAEVIREIIEKAMEEQAADEQISEEVQERIDRARNQEDGGDLRELIDDLF